MRRILLVIVVSILCATSALSKESDSLHLKSSSISVDSLVAKLNTLQNSYDFLYCDYEINKVIAKLSEFSNTTNITSNSILINCYHSRFDRNLYSAYLLLFDAKTENLNALIENVEITTSLIMTKVLLSNFTEQEIILIHTGLDTIESQLSTAEKALNYFEVVLDMYRRAK